MRISAMFGFLLVAYTVSATKAPTKKPTMKPLISHHPSTYQLCQRLNQRAVQD